MVEDTKQTQEKTKNSKKTCSVFEHIYRQPRLFTKESIKTEDLNAQWMNTLGTGNLSKERLCACCCRIYYHVGNNFKNFMWLCWDLIYLSRRILRKKRKWNKNTSSDYVNNMPNTKICVLYNEKLSLAWRKFRIGFDYWGLEILNIKTRNCHKF